LSAPFTQILTLDAETRWSSKPTDWCEAPFSLSKITNEEYVRSHHFKAFGFCVHVYGSDAPIRWVSHADLPEYFASIDWENTAVLAHNAQFDISVLDWVYNCRPAFIFDTLSMGRALRGVEVGNSLMKLAEDFGLPPKGDAVYSTDGLANLTPQIEHELAEYCKHDVYLCEQIFARFIEGYPKSELRLIDMTLKMYTQPVLELDRKMLITALADEVEQRESLLKRLQIDEKDLSSNPKFARILETLGVPAPMKKSKTTGKPALALAKSDALFQALLNGGNEEIAVLCEARLKVKSTTERTRAQRFLDISGRGALPVPLSYYGASTGRWTACLVAETEVVVYDRHNGQCSKRIVDVLPDDLVWDGVEFVQHEGVQFSGYREVIEHDGITGTPDHKVFIDDETTISLFDALQRGQSIMDAAEPDVRDLEAARTRLNQHAKA
jgi:hypothetical protein